MRYGVTPLSPAHLTQCPEFPIFPWKLNIIVLMVVMVTMPGSNISYPISEGGEKQTQLLTRHATDTRDAWTQSYYGAQKFMFLKVI